MIHISYKLDKSDIHGIGLFAMEDLPQGALVYSSSPLLDLELTQAQYDSLAENEKREVRHWGFWIEEQQVWHVDFDVSKFINHSVNATLTQDPAHLDAWLTTTRPVKSGEDLTQNYLEFETEEDLKNRGLSTK